MIGQMTAKCILQRGRDEEELLAQPELTAALMAVDRIEHARDVLADHAMLERALVVARVEVAEIEILGSARAPQPKGVDRVRAVAWHRRVVGHGQHIAGVTPAVS